MSKEEPLALLISDLHLSARTPVFRSVEENWFAAMARPLEQIRELAKQYGVPIICAGDIFDRWNSPPELINFALAALPDMFAIPGQHDLPNHSYEELPRSAFWTLSHTGKVVVLSKEEPIQHGKLIMHGFSWNEEVVFLKERVEGCYHIAVAHDYVWIPKCKYENAPIEKQLGIDNRKARGGRWLNYDAVVYGDNHIGFLTHLYNTPVFNCGSMMRTKSDQLDYKPMVGLLKCDNTTGKLHVDKMMLDISQDQTLEVSKAVDAEEAELDTEEFFENLRSLGVKSLDFGLAVERLCQRGEIEPEVADVLKNSIEVCRED